MQFSRCKRCGVYCLVATDLGMQVHVIFCVSVGQVMHASSKRAYEVVDSNRVRHVTSTTTCVFTIVGYLCLFGFVVDVFLYFCAGVSCIVNY